MSEADVVAADEDGRDAEPPATGRVLFKSFFALIVSLIGFYGLAIAGQGIVTALFFPAEMEVLWAGDSKEEPAAAHVEYDHQPSALFWALGLLIYTGSAFLAGAFLTRMAPLHPIGHSVLLAAFLFLNALQPNEDAIFDRPAWAMALFTFAVPSAVLISAWLFAPRELESNEQHVDEANRRDA